MTSRDPALLHWKARKMDEALEARALEYGIQTRLIETYRDNTAQMQAWRQGRDENGMVVDKNKVVTWKKPGDSWHNLTMPDGTPCSLAFHRAIVCSRGLLGFGHGLGPIGVEMYKCLGRIGMTIGLRWGGNWDMDSNLSEPGENDYTHFEVYGFGTLSQVRAAMQAGKDIVDLQRA